MGILHIFCNYRLKNEAQPQGSEGTKNTSAVDGASK